MKIPEGFCRPLKAVFFFYFIILLFYCFFNLELIKKIKIIKEQKKNLN